MSRNFSLHTALLLFGFFGFSISAHAQIAYTVSPLVLDVEAEGRDIINKTIILTNTGSVPITVYPTVNNISLKEGGTIDEFVDQVMSDRTTSLASWIEVSRRGIDLIPGEPYTLPITFRMGPNPVPGTYHALIGFGYGRNQDEAMRQVRNAQAPGTVVSLTVKDETVTFLKLAQFVIDRFIVNPENTGALYTFKNPGEETVVPTGEIILYDMKGKEVGSVPVNPTNKSIAPGGEETFAMRIPIEGLFGKYKAFLSVEYGVTQRASIQDTNFFYALPLSYVLSLFGILAVVVMVLAWYIHRQYLHVDETEETDRITLRIKDGHSEEREHDLNLCKS